ncbi:MAG: hypothetical protein G3M70_01820 [Candidatus Nitronauta litoralis]|uniref:Uncharacterized protein n=1 Tax=Candidatus Nitronauta litoralis TaxID=2705533 RepID=A0A7T0FZD2_9BACT|nr:MAG: hypothetical protein G3M70_01820 [Candidatus Nitronauta litoralis]
MANVELLSTQLFQLFSALQRDIPALLNALTTQQGQVATLQTSVTDLQNRFNGITRTEDNLVLQR